MRTDPKSVGERSEGIIIAAFLRAGKTVLMPNKRSDNAAERRLKTCRAVHKELNDRTGLIDFEGAGYIPESAHSFLVGVERLDEYVVTDLWSSLRSIHILDHLDEFEQSALSDPYRLLAGEASLMRRLDEVEVQETAHWFIGPID
ncbi:MAG: hypothetical protein E6R04_00755 [Spirochaetes bacterium]|nr:MAG: hypothetical protein E6R04_00755 [Spirochaetota bacterium]